MSNHGTDYFVHPTAIIDIGVKVGSESKIWHFTHMMKNASLGTCCVIGQNCFVGSDVKIGDHVKIQNNVSIFEGVELSDEVFIGPSVVFTNVLNPRSFINQKGNYLPTLIGRGATIGANSTIVCGVSIGEYAFIGAGSIISQEVKPYALIYGAPAHQQGWVSKAGQKLFFNSDGLASCPKTQELYQFRGDSISLL